MTLKPDKDEEEMHFLWKQISDKSENFDFLLLYIQAYNLKTRKSQFFLITSFTLMDGEKIK